MSRHRRGRRRVARVLAAALAVAAHGPAAALDATEIAVLYGAHDADGAALARYYAEQRGVPERNLLAVDVDTAQPDLPLDRFTAVERELEAHLAPRIQAYALAWTRPYRVGCMSVTSAFALGFDQRYCASGCRPTAPSPYFGSSSHMPYRDHGLRPAMLLAARSPKGARALVGRGIAADATHPPGTAYLIVTPDRARSTRVPRYARAARLFAGRQRIRIIADHGDPFHDVMFYFTGAKRVARLEHFTFRPGAVADHLTSSGGVLDGSAQMSILDWIEAGATASYGTVVEPCNYPQKFPDPVVLMGQYLNGDTLIEAYWKSVRWPGQGVFVGAPLARPFARR